MDLRLTTAALVTAVMMPALTACSVDTATFYAPIHVQIAPEEASFVVIQNLNAPRDCRAVPADSVFPAIYRVAYGPAIESAAHRFAARCRRSGRG